MGETGVNSEMLVTHQRQPPGLYECASYHPSAPSHPGPGALAKAWTWPGPGKITWSHALAAPTASRLRYHRRFPYCY